VLLQSDSYIDHWSNPRISRFAIIVSTPAFAGCRAPFGERDSSVACRALSPGFFFVLATNPTPPPCNLSPPESDVRCFMDALSTLCDLDWHVAGKKKKKKKKGERKKRGTEGAMYI
jgi:hypothetical protein